VTWAGAFDAAPGNLNTLKKRQVCALVRQQYKDKYPHFKFSEAPDDEAMAREQAETWESSG
jgi:hypothetical protein